MASAIDIKVIVKKPLNGLKRASAMADGANRVLQRGARKIERSAKRRVPVNYGIVRAYIRAVGPIREPVGPTIIAAKTPQAQSALFERMGIFWKVGVQNLLYARFIEFGTGPAGKQSKLLPEARAAMAELGYTHGPGNFMPPVAAIARWAKRRKIDPSLIYVIARSIGIEGIPAQPYLFPSFVEHRASIVTEMRALVTKVLQ